MAEFSDLIGKTLERVEATDEDVTFFTTEGTAYRLWHRQDCCESVYLEDVCGSLEDLIQSPILMAEEVVHEGEHPEGVPEPEFPAESFTWTFYKLATVKGYVTLRWYGSSNGYYSESVDFTDWEYS